jgi:hypothetical protein
MKTFCLKWIMAAHNAFRHWLNAPFFDNRRLLMQNDHSTQVQLMGEGEITLKKGDLWKTERNSLGLYLLCQEGIVWITQEGNTRDILLKTGEKCWLDRPGLVIAQALVTAKILVTRDSTRTFAIE